MNYNPKSVILLRQSVKHPRLLATKAMTAAVGADIREKLENPFKFQWGTGGADSPPPSVIYGFDATLLIDVCNAIIAAEATGKLRRPRVAKLREEILDALYNRHGRTIPGAALSCDPRAPA